MADINVTSDATQWVVEAFADDSNQRRELRIVQDEVDDPGVDGNGDPIPLPPIATRVRAMAFGWAHDSVDVSRTRRARAEFQKVSDLITAGKTTQAKFDAAKPFLKDLLDGLMETAEVK